MNGFDAGALYFKIQAVGAQVFRRDTQEADRAVEKLGQSAERAAQKTTELGTSTDITGRKARAAKTPLEEQARATEKVGNEARSAKAKQVEQAKASDAQAESARNLSVALLAAGVAVTALVGLSVARFATFDQGMSNVAAATMATADEQERLADAALEAGASTAYSAREAADAEEELAKAGLNTSTIVGGGLKSSLALAAAGQLEVARSATIMATTLTQFGLTGKDASAVADLLAAGAGKAQGSVEDLANALKFVGPVAASLGLSLEETTGILALFAEQGIIGEQAGTALRGVLSSLTSPSALAAKTMEQYGISVFDANGKMKSGAQIAQVLQSSLGNLTDAERSAAMGRIFGNEQLTAATILMRGGANAVDEWTAAVNDSGFAAEQAAKRQDNLAGDIEKLGGAFDTALIRTGSGANDVLREGVQLVTELVDWYGELPEEIQATALVLGLATGAMLLFSGGALGAIARFAELKQTLEAANMSMGKTALIAGGVGIALTAVVAVVGMIAAAQAEARQKAQAYADTLESGTNRITKATRDMLQENLAAKKSMWFFEGDSAFDAAEKLGLSLEQVTDAAAGNADALRAVRSQLAELSGGSTQEFKERMDQMGLSMSDYVLLTETLEQAIAGESGSIDEAIKKADQKDRANQDVAESEQTAAEAYKASADEVSGYAGELNDLIDKILQLNGLNQDAASAQIDYGNSLADVDDIIRQATEGIDANGDGLADYTLTLDQATQAGRDNKEMLIGLAQDAEEAARKQFELDGNTEKYRETLESSQQALYDRILAFTGNADAAAALTEEIFNIPTETEWKMIADTSVAMQQAEAMAQKIRDIPNSKEVYVYIEEQRRLSGAPAGQVGAAYGANGFVLEAYANGGMREHHVAQIAKAGTYRVWAEDETGGEAYIPLAQSKRSRSTAILAETASRFGYELSPSGGGRGASAAPASGGGGSLAVTQINNFAPGLDETAVAARSKKNLNDMIRKNGG